MIGLRGIRKAKGLNQLQVAMALNISREALSHDEKTLPIEAEFCHHLFNINYNL